MKTKIGIHNRIFITFSIFIIILVNLFSYLLYYFVINNYVENIYKNINLIYEDIKDFIDLENNFFLILPENQLKKINSMGFFTYIGNNNESLNLKYSYGLNNNSSEIYFKGNYHNYDIIIGKNINDFFIIRQNFINITIILNILVIILVFIITYFLTKNLLKPFFEISNFINNYDLKTKKVFKNDFGNSDLGIYINSINKFLLKIKDNFDSQKDFIQDTSHELKTPLMQIDSTIDTIENKITDENILYKLSNIKSSISKINFILSSLSFLLRGDEKTLKSEKINLNNYLKNFINDYFDLAKSKNLDILILENVTLEIFSNKYYIERLFSNLLINAIYYNNGNGVIKIILDKNFIDIVDNGIGIKKSEINKIFNRFYRNNDSNIYLKNGSGLGLSIVKKIIDIFNWKIEILDTVGGGTTFRVYF